MPIVYKEGRQKPIVRGTYEGIFAGTFWELGDNRVSQKKKKTGSLYKVAGPRRRVGWGPPRLVTAIGPGEGSAFARRNVPLGGGMK